MDHPQRLRRADAGFLALEDRRGLHMHAGCVLAFDGTAPELALLTERIRSRLDRVRRYGRILVAGGRFNDQPAWVGAPRASSRRRRPAALCAIRDAR